MERVDLLVRCSFLDRANVLVLDCGESARHVKETIPILMRRFPGLFVLLVDGGLSQKEIASAFKGGVKDYFPDPYDVQLLVERTDSLCTNFLKGDYKCEL